jgi:hypothetical protein
MALEQINLIYFLNICICLFIRIREQEHCSWFLNVKGWK